MRFDMDPRDFKTTFLNPKKIFFIHNTIPKGLLFLPFCGLSRMAKDNVKFRER